MTTKQRAKKSTAKKSNSRKPTDFTHKKGERRSGPTHDDLIDDLKRVHRELPESNVTRNFYRANGKFSEAAWQKFFGRFSDFCAAAGIEAEEDAKNEPELGRSDDVTENEWVVSLPKTRIHTLDQLIEFCEVDTSIWQVDRFQCNKWEVGFGAKNSGTGKIKIEPLYQIKAIFKKKVVQQLILQEIALLKGRAAQYSPKFPMLNLKTRRGASGNWVEHSLYDHHFGAHIWGKETGHDDYDLPIAKEGWEAAITKLVERTDSFHPEGALFVLGNDMVNADNRQGSTEMGTQQSMDTRYQKVYGVARDAAVWAIDLMLGHYGRVHVPMVGGNHDPLSTWHLGDYLSAWYRNNPNVTIDNSPEFRKWWEHGVNMLMFSHGNKGKLEDYGKTMAAEKPEMWGRTKWREAHTGDKHQRRLIEFAGHSVRILPTLRPPCGWTSENMYLSLRVAESFVWSHDEGLIGQAGYAILPGRGLKG